MSAIISRRLVLGMVLSTGTVAVAMAQPGPGMMSTHGQGMMGSPGGMMGGNWNTASYLDGLKTQLDIKPSQESAWKDYADIVSGVGEQMQELHQTMFESMGTASWQERRNLMDQMFQGRQQAADMVHDAATKLLASLDPAQKTKAQSILPGLTYRRGMMGYR